MPELRLNLISREWVIVPTEKARAPEQFRQRGNRKHIPDVDPSCPFCPGNESKTPDEIFRLPADGPWKLRGTPNKFPYFDVTGERVRINDGLRRKVTGVGRHEVIIESPHHNASFAHMDIPDLVDILKAYKARFNDAFMDRRIQHLIIFKNHGPESGTSIVHPHSQLLGSPVIPLEIRYRVDEAMRFFDNTGQCLMCAMVEDEMRDRARVIAENDRFISFVPFAALSPFHLWVFPKQHMPSFGNVSDEDIEAMAPLLKEVHQRLYHGLNDPSYNMVLRTLSPFRSRSEYVHWYMSIVPRVMPSSGFELGTGIYVNPSVPEEIAQFLRDTRIS